MSGALEFELFKLNRVEQEFGFKDVNNNEVIASGW